MSARRQRIFARSREPILPADGLAANFVQPLDDRANGRRTAVAMNLELLLPTAAKNQLFAFGAGPATEHDSIGRDSFINPASRQFDCHGIEHLKRLVQNQ